MTSLVNCHVRGLHSLALSDPPRMRRIFFTTPDHELLGPDAVALHTHHCDLTLVPLVNAEAINHYRPLRQSPRGATPLPQKEYHGYLFDSAISGGGSFVRTGDVRVFCLAASRLTVPVCLASYDVHTVSVESGQVAAWLVVEGAEDPTYDKKAWSPRDLSTWAPKGLYQPMTLAWFISRLPELIGLD